jgi:hypothetical protein
MISMGSTKPQNWSLLSEFRGAEMDATHLQHPGVSR